MRFRYLFVFVLVLPSCASSSPNRTNWSVFQGQYGGKKGFSPSELACLKRNPPVAKAIEASTSLDLYDRMRPYQNQELECFGNRLVGALAERSSKLSVCQTELIDSSMRRYVEENKGSIVDFFQQSPTVIAKLLESCSPSG
jgi:hypothetical protein